MKSKLDPGCAPVLLLGKGDLQRLESGWKVLEEIAYKGRNGCVIGDVPCTGQLVMTLAFEVLNIIKAAKGVEAAAPPPTRGEKGDTHQEAPAAGP